MTYLLGFLLFIFLMWAITTIMKSKPKLIKDDVKEMELEDLQECLDWMFQLGIINSIEYNDFYTKSLPYLK